MKEVPIFMTRKTDEWYTPIEAVNLIEPFIRAKGFQKILCPFDKAESNYVKEFIKCGYEVTYSHIDDGTDFFDRNDLEEFDAIVSNPPFSKRTEVFTRLFESGVPFAMIMNFLGLFDSAARWNLFRSNEFEFLIPERRIRFFNKDGTGTAPVCHSIYVCSKILPEKIVFSNYKQNCIVKKT